MLNKKFGLKIEIFTITSKLYHCYSNISHSLVSIVTNTLFKLLCSIKLIYLIVLYLLFLHNYF